MPNIRSTKHKIRTRTWISIWLLCLFVPLIAILLLKPRGTEAAWMDDAWKYRKSINIASHTALETNVYVTVPAFDATDTTRFQADCGDLRFTKENGELLPYYVNDCDASSTVRVFWDSLPAGEQNYYMYYGNSSAPNGFSATDFATAATNLGSLTAGSETKSQGPVAYWKFDEGVNDTCSGGSNDTCNSAGDTSYDGAITNAVWKTEDMCTSGKCLFFDGTGDYVSAGGAATAMGSYTTGSVSFWFKRPSAGTNQALFYIGVTGSDKNLLSFMFTSANTLQILLKDNNSSDVYRSTVDLGTSASNSSWNYLAFTDSTSGNTLYYNGNPVTLTYTSGNASTDGWLDNLTGEDSLLIGARDVSGITNYFTGFIDEVKVYNYARSAAQVKADFAAKTGSTKGVSAAMGTGNQKSLSDGLVGYWKMDEASWTVDCSTTSVTDSSGNGNNGKACPNSTGPAGGAIGKFGNSGSFDGSNDAIQVSSAANIPATNTTQTLSAWVKPAAMTSTRDILITTNGSQGNQLMMSGSNAYVSAWGGSAIITSTGVLTTGTWYLITWTYDGTTNRLYINGVLDSSNTTSPQTGTPNTVYIGSWTANDGGENFNGSLDELRIYNRALSTTEVRQLYNWAPGPIGYWPMDEGKWNGTTGEVKDLSGNANNGTAQNGAIVAPGKFGNGGNLDGVNDYVSVASSTTFDLTSYTLEAWVFPRAYGTLIDAISRRTGENCYSLSWETGGNIATRIGNSTCETRSATTAIPLNSWHHIAVTYNSVTDAVELYLDGRLDGSATDSDGPGTMAATQLAIGAYTTGTGDNVNGIIDEVKIYNYARTSLQIMEDLNGGHPMGGSPVSSQLVYWNFDEGQGTTANNKGTASSSNGTLTSIASPATATSGWTASGKVNKGIVFDGSDDKVVLATASDAAVDFNGSESFSASAWIYPTTVPTSATEEDLILGKWDQASAQRGYRIFLENDDTDSTGRISVEIYDESTDQTISVTGANDSISENTWYHVAFTFNGGAAGAANDLKLFVNGRQIGGNSANASFLGLEDVTSDFTVGDYDATDNTAALTAFTGRIDEVKVYPGVLSIDNIQVDMNTGAAAAIQPAQSSTNESSYVIDGAGNPPTGYWNFDENTGTTVNDISGNGNTGTINTPSTYAWKPGKFGSALELDGATSFVSLASSQVLGANATEEVWINTTDSTDNMIVLYNGSSSDLRINLNSQGNPDYFYWNGSSYQGLTGNATVTDGKWHHLAVVIDTTNSKLTLYVDGVYDNSASITGSLNVQISGIGQAGYASGNYKGMVDEVKVYDYARTPAQIAYDYNRGGPLIWWKMDECQGTTLSDSTGNGSSATLTITATGGNTNGVGTCGTATSAWGTGATGKFNSGINLDGNGDYGSIAANTIINSIQDRISVSLWIKPTTITADDWGRFISRGSSPDQKWEIEFNGAGKIAYVGGAYNESNITLTAGNWYHIVMTYDTAANSTKLYVNGRLDSSVAGNATISDTTDIGIGADPNGSGNFNGIIDDVRIYSYALSADQIKILYNDGAVKFGPATGQP